MKKKLLICTIFLFFFLFFARGGWLPTAIRLDTGDPAGVNNSYNPQVSNSGSNVYAVWYDTRNGRTDIYFNYSADWGATWQAADTRLDTGDTPGGNYSYSPKISIYGPNVYVVWEDDRNGKYDIYFNYSTDWGATWQASDIRLDTGDISGLSDSRAPRISSNASNVYVVWEDYRNGRFDIYFNYSADWGATWQASDIRIDKKDTPGPIHSEHPKISCSGSNVYVVWHDDRNAHEDIYFNYSNDWGATWQASDIRLDTGDPAGAKSSVFPEISSSGNNVYVVWYDWRNGGPHIYFNYSRDGGATWQASDIQLTKGSSESWIPRISSSGSDVYVVWNDDRNGFPDIYFNYSTDWGATWQPVEIRLDTGDGLGMSCSWDPRIINSGGYVYVVWYDDRNGEYDIYLNYSKDRGATWQASDIRIDTGDPAGANDSKTPHLSSDINNVYVIWYDYRNGNSDIYFNTKHFLKYSLTIAANEGGTTRPEPGKHSYEEGTDVKIEAFNDEGYRFIHWSGDVRGKDNPITITMDSDKSVKANFERGIKTYTLSIKSVTGGTTSPAPGISSYKEGTEVTIKAIPNTYFRFSHWSGDISSLDNPITIIMDSDKSIKANFIRQYTVIVESGSGGTTNPAPGSYIYDKGSTVTITAIPDDYYQFSGWSGDRSALANPITIRMNSDKSLIASFIRIIYSPLNITGQKVLNRSFSQAEYINVFSWQSNPNNMNIMKYRIYQIEGVSQSLLIELNANTFEYWHRGVEKDKLYIYAICAVNSEEREGDPTYVTVK